MARAAFLFYSSQALVVCVLDWLKPRSIRGFRVKYPNFMVRQKIIIQTGWLDMFDGPASRLTSWLDMFDGSGSQLDVRHVHTHAEVKGNDEEDRLIELDSDLRHNLMVYWHCKSRCELHIYFFNLFSTVLWTSKIILLFNTFRFYFFSSVSTVSLNTKITTT